MSRLIIRGGTVVLPHEVTKADIAIENGRITDIAEGLARQAEEAGDTVVDAEGRWVLPGLVDIHCDAIEKETEPRPNTLFPMMMAFLQFEKKLAGHGITTMLHSLSLGVGLSLRGENLVSQMIELIRACREERSMIRHGIHLRYEVSHLTGMPLARKLIEEGAVDYLSLMDHAPGIGQYRKPGAFERYVMKNQGVGVDEVAHIVAELQEKRKRVDWDTLRDLTGYARECGIAIASHDDDSKEAVERSLAFHADVSEFPLDMETARFACNRGMNVCVGAPNIVRGGSHDGNLNAAEAVRADAADIICSDYHPASLLQAVFDLEKQGVPLSEAAALASLNPSRAIGREGEIGSLEPGKAADLILVRKWRDYPLVETTVVGGSIVYECRDRER
ncbi:alpha-D-ribose 1-methylphosphonate 5-triphosphate diphosphatase [Cohnella pontilimi]|uniref:Alpha-D-ribose 1-methylphosphonate 5-triphosphate diphosphatase n=1 Tax=Cohnella pontilimi TaxID=2564100 RepID=A0A4U0F5G8_9BACL|nr:alpha-D-ribose 1-methylphosphonate 5-triphosphate diphosphatase [Cohnella pontilimi]TJY39851.1 alpha-D-ribose 1-methylphosphonate 5-triphosphate diphosphatase [Cohnella pontilimi]